MATINPYLQFNGDCEEAFNYYAKVLNGKILFSVTFGGSPMESEVPAEWHNKWMHATMVVGDQEQILMGSDVFPNGYESPRAMSVLIDVSDVDDAQRIFDALSDGGKVTMPFEKTFWAERFGSVRDRFGTPWQVNCNLPNPEN